MDNYTSYTDLGVSKGILGTASCKDPNNMASYGISCINLKAKHSKLKGWQKASKRK